jgi:hypothetical protein
VTADFFTNSRRFMGLTGIRVSWDWLGLG